MALVPQGKMTKSEFLIHKKKCSVQPNAHLQGKDKYKYGKPDPPFDVYRITTTGIIFPKYYALEYIKIKQCQDMYNTQPQHICLQFNGTLRPHQEKSVDLIQQSYNSCGGALLCLGCGLGKTVVANYIISKMNVKTVVLVHKEFLLNQWKERIQYFLPNAKIGKVQGKIIDVKNKDIIIAMLQTVAMKEFDDIFHDCGQLIVDECHHIAARVFCNALFKMPVKYTLGLSATPNRSDGLEYVIHWFLGPTVLTMENISENNVQVHMKEFDLEYPPEEYNKMGKLALPLMITNLSNMKDRNQNIVEITLELLKQNDRNILILSERREQLKSLFNIFTSLHQSVGLYIGGMKEKELKSAESKKVMLSTYAMTSEGFDNPELNTLIFATPKTNIEQSVGRILRKVHDIDPIIIDLIDNYSLFKIQGYQRRYFYKNKQYTITKDGSIENVQAQHESEHESEHPILKDYAFIDD